MSRLLPAVNAAAWTTALGQQLRSSAPASWRRTNFRGREVSLSGGVATAVGVLAGVAGSGGAVTRAGVVAVGAAGGLGALDDLVERPEDRSTKGLRGHLQALARGQVTTGAVKLLGITAASLAAGSVLARDRARGGDSAPVTVLVDGITSGALVAGTANLLNLFDLRPGRAVKVATLVAAPLALVPGAGRGPAAAVLGAGAAALPGDLGETTMLGDTGANALGAALGVALASQTRAVRLGALAVVVAATVTSERVSFSRVIEATPALAWLDRLGRLDDR